MKILYTNFIFILKLADFQIKIILYVYMYPYDKYYITIAIVNIFILVLNINIFLPRHIWVPTIIHTLVIDTHICIISYFKCKYIQT